MKPVIIMNLFLFLRMNSSRGFYKPSAGGYHQGPRHYRGRGSSGGHPFRGRGRGRGGW